VDLLAGDLGDILELHADAEAVRRQGGDPDDPGGDVERALVAAEDDPQVELAGEVRVEIGQGDEGAAVGDVEDSAIAEARDGAGEGARDSGVDAAVAGAAVRLYVHGDNPTEGPCVLWNSGPAFDLERADARARARRRMTFEPGQRPISLRQSSRERIRK
jgi:hypothetical protein